VPNPEISAYWRHPYRPDRGHHGTAVSCQFIVPHAKKARRKKVPAAVRWGSGTFNNRFH